MSDDDNNLRRLHLVPEGGDHRTAGGRLRLLTPPSAPTGERQARDEDLRALIRQLGERQPKRRPAGPDDHPPAAA